MSDLSPHAAETLRAASAALSESGEALDGLKPSRAEAGARRALEDLDRLASDEPDLAESPQVIQLRASAWDTRAHAAQLRDDWDEALEYQRRALALRDGLTREACAAAQVPYDAPLAVSCLNLGTLLLAVERREEAEEHLRRAVEHVDRLPEDEATDLLGLTARRTLAMTLAASGRVPEAASTFAEAIERVRERMAGAEDDDTQPMTHLIEPYVGILVQGAAAVYAAGYDRDAVALLDEAAAISGALAEDFPEETGHWAAPHYVAAQLNLLAVHEAAGRFDKAEDALFRALAIEPPGVEEIVARGRAFYASLLGRSDDELRDGGLPREEVRESLEELETKAAALAHRAADGGDDADAPG